MLVGHKELKTICCNDEVRLQLESRMCRILVMASHRQEHNRHKMACKGMDGQQTRRTLSTDIDREQPCSKGNA